jgi:hypothetical protein
MKQIANVTFPFLSNTRIWLSISFLTVDGLCIVSQINNQTGRYLSFETRFTQAEALLFLVHFVGGKITTPLCDAVIKK